MRTGAVINLAAMVWPFKLQSLGFRLAPMNNNGSDQRGGAAQGGVAGPPPGASNSPPGSTPAGGAPSAAGPTTAAGGEGLVRALREALAGHQQSSGTSGTLEVRQRVEISPWKGKASPSSLVMCMPIFLCFRVHFCRP